jgi:poly-gamma-glutamate capsule biosynthesis protein CapA/YwtB (metallophosphatase superfamily)
MTAVFVPACNQPAEKKNFTSSVNSDSIYSEKNKNKKDSLISLIGVGDIMLGSNYPHSSSLPPDDGRFLLDSVKNFLNKADIVFGNLEGTFLDKGGDPKICNTPDNCYSFRTPENYCGILKNAGFNLVSLANNHSNDMGEEGRESTIRTLKKNKIEFAGYSDIPSVIFEKDKIKYGFTAFAPNYSAQDINDLANAVKTVKELKEKCDFVIVSFHGGAEGSTAVRVPKRKEFFSGGRPGRCF